MPGVYDRIDLLWTSRGDLYEGYDGDVMDTSWDPLRSVVQESLTRIKSDQGDWQLYPGIGATISDFVGELNNKATSENLKTRVTASLAQYGLINTRDLKIMTMPIARDKLLMRISLKVASTTENASSESLSINAVYSYSDNNVYFLR
jgi:hypothetical protein